MKKSALVGSFVVLVLALSVPAAAQQSDNASITARATVAQGLSVAFGSDLEFGTILPGFDVTVDPAAALPAGTTLGRFDVTGAGNAPVILEFTSTPDLSGPGDPIAVAYNAAYNSTITPAGATGFDPEAGPVNSALVSGELYVFVGGTATTSQTQLQGDYTATVTLQVTYGAN